LAQAGIDAFHDSRKPGNNVRRAVFVQAYLPGKEQRRLDVGFDRIVQADGCSLDLGIGQFDLSFFLAHHEHERLCGSLRNDLDVERMGFGNDLSADQTVFFSGKRQFLLFICRAGHSCRDRCSIQGQRPCLCRTARFAAEARHRLPTAALPG
jgi:hypothetical protein